MSSQSCVGSSNLPPYQGILAVDAERGAAGSARDQYNVSGLIPGLICQTLYQSGVGEVWNDPPFRESSGDSLVIGVPSRILPRLVYPFLDHLQDLLAAYNRRASAAEARVRLRVSLHVGPLADGSHSLRFWGDGAARREARLLLDSESLNRTLADSDPQAVHVAAILSDRLYGDVVLPGYCGRRPDQFQRVPAALRSDAVVQWAWIALPRRPAAFLL